MASRSTPPCDHELRPGTTVCLRCQHAERAAKRARQRQMIARGAAATLVLAVIAAVGVAGATAIRARIGAKGAEAPARTDAPATMPSAAADSTTEPSAPPTTDSVARSAVATSYAPATLTPSSTPTPRVAAPVSASPGLGVAPVVPVGRTALRDTMVAERAGDTVRVSFDLVLARTRRPDKFEAIVRSTLPQVYGSAVDSALRALPVGAVAQAGDLFTTLPERGFRIPLPGGRTIAVWPETRSGRDGPLVVAYRAVASR
jgi:hypothetical protein